VSTVVPEVVTVRLTEVLCDVLPPVPVTVMVDVPAVAVAPTVIVMVEEPEPGAAIDVGLKATVTFAGTPEADRATALLNPPETPVVIVTLPAPPWAIDVELGEAEIVKSGVGTVVTVRLTDVLCVVLPPVPVMVIG
jgi:hypothetical protein